MVDHYVHSSKGHDGQLEDVECVVPASKTQCDRASVTSLGFASVSKIEGMSAQDDARKYSDKNPRTAGSEANIEGPSEWDNDVLSLSIV